MTCVYFVETEDGRFIKIGSTSNLRQRIAALYTGAPVPIRLIGWMPGVGEDERALHKRFEAERPTGEWFSCSMRLREFLQHSNLRLLEEFPPVRERRKFRRLPALLDEGNGATVRRADATIGAFRRLVSRLRRYEHPALHDANEAISLMSKYTASKTRITWKEVVELEARKVK